MRAHSSHPPPTTHGTHHPPHTPGVDPRLADHSHAQKGISLKLPEATALVDAIMHGRVHKDFVYVGGQQCETAPQAPHATSGHVSQPQLALADLITTVTENAYFGRCTSTSAVSGVALVKTAKTLLVATWTDPVAAAAAIPHVLKIADDMQSSS